jgi:polyvinyl alcohol dehydrogenase (cytochrome)
VHALDPDSKGKILWQTRIAQGGYLGGSQWGSASDGEKAYVATSDIGLGGKPDAGAPGGFRLVLDPKLGGGLHALDLKTGKIVWTAKPAPCAVNRTDCSPAQSAAVTVIPGVVFSGSLDGHLRAYSTGTGEVIWDVDTARPGEAGPKGPGEGNEFAKGTPTKPAGPYEKRPHILGTNPDIDCLRFRQYYAPE